MSIQIFRKSISAIVQRLRIIMHILIMNHYHDVFVLQELSMYCKLRRIDTLFIVIVYCNLS